MRPQGNLVLCNRIMSPGRGKHVVKIKPRFCRDWQSSSSASPVPWTSIHHPPGIFLTSLVLNCPVSCILCLPFLVYSLLFWWSSSPRSFWEKGGNFIETLHVWKYLFYPHISLTVWRRVEFYIGNCLRLEFWRHGSTVILISSVAFEKFLKPLGSWSFVHIPCRPLWNFHSVPSVLYFHGNLPWYLSVLIHCARPGSGNFFCKGPCV